MNEWSLASIQITLSPTVRENQTIVGSTGEDAPWRTGFAHPRRAGACRACLVDAAFLRLPRCAESMSFDQIRDLRSDETSRLRDSAKLRIEPMPWCSRAASHLCLKNRSRRNFRLPWLAEYPFSNGIRSMSPARAVSSNVVIARIRSRPNTYLGRARGVKTHHEHASPLVDFMRDTSASPTFASDPGVSVYDSSPPSNP
jgi:hypothetical protein